MCFRTSMKTFKQHIKNIVPDGLWFRIRKLLIINKHLYVAFRMRKIVDRCDDKRLSTKKIIPKTNVPKDCKLIWQYWAQGFDNDKLPEIVKICLDSVCEHADGYKIIRLSDNNLSEYIDIPQYIQDKRSCMSHAHFSDLLRLMLLSTYGGTWIDASVLLTGKLPSFFFDEEFFMYQRDNRETHKEYWENSYAYYFGWYKGFRVNVLNGIMSSKAGSTIITDLCLMMLEYWKYNNKACDYFFFQVLFDVYIKKHPEYNCKIVNDCIPHLLRQLLVGNYPITFEEVLEQTPIHTLSRKNQASLPKLKQLLAL